MLLSKTRLIWLFEKNAWRNWRTRERQNHVTITNCRSLLPHTDILNDVIQQDGRPILPCNNNKVWLNVLWFNDILDILVRIIKELAYLLLFYYSELIYRCFKDVFIKSFVKKILRYQWNVILQGYSIGYVFYFFNLFEEIPIEMWMRYTPLNQINQRRIKLLY